MVKKISKSSQTYLLKRYYPEILIFLSLFFLLIYRLSEFPSFGDEAYMIFLGWLLKRGGSYIGYIDGVAPLFSYSTSYALKIFDNPLLAGRMVSAIAGILGSIGVYFFINSLHGRVSALISSILYVTLPMTFIYHRFALRESLLIMAGVYVLLFSHYLMKSESKKWLFIILTALSLTAGLFAKQHAALFFAYPLMTYLADIFQTNKDKFDKAKKIILSYFFSLIFIAIIVIPQYEAILTMRGILGSVAVRTISEVDSVRNLLDNTLSLGEVFYLYFGVFFLFSIIYLFYKSVRQKNFYNLFLILFPIFIICIYIFAEHSLFSTTRYLVPIFLPWFILSGIAVLEFIEIFNKIKPNLRYFMIFLFAVIIFFQSANFIYKYLYDSANTPFTKRDRNDFVLSAGAGFGLFEAFEYLEKLSESRPIFVITEPGSGPKNWPLMLYEKNPNIKVASWSGFRATSVSPYINVPVYAVLDDDPLNGSHYYFKQANPDAELIKRYWRPGRKTYIDIVLIRPKSDLK